MACLAAAGRSAADSDPTGFSYLALQSGASAFVGAFVEIGDVTTVILAVDPFRMLVASRRSTCIADLWRQAQAEFDSTAGGSNSVGFPRGGGW